MALVLKITRSLLRFVFALAVLLVLMAFFEGCSGTKLKNWHNKKLTEEFTAGMKGDVVRDFGDYLSLEDRLQIAARGQPVAGSGADQYQFP